MPRTCTICRHAERAAIDAALVERRPFRDILLESVAGPISTIRSPTCLWNEDGRLYGFEGCHGASTSRGAFAGCCPMNCTHVWNYEMALSKLFPDLEQDARRTVWEACTEEEERLLQAGGAALMPGAGAALAALAEAGVRLGIASNCSRGYLDHMLTALELDRTIDALGFD